MIKFVGKATRFETEKIKMMRKMNFAPEMEMMQSFFCVGLEEQTVYVSKEFRMNAMRFGTCEAMAMCQLNGQFPTFVMKEIN